MKKRPAGHTLLQQELDRLAYLEAGVADLEAANPQPFPQPGSICRCGTHGGSADACSKAHFTPRAKVLIPCNCWCHVTDHWRIDMWNEHLAQQRPDK